MRGVCESLIIVVTQLNIASRLNAHPPYIHTSLLVAPPRQIPEVGLASESLLDPSPTLPYLSPSSSTGLSETGRISCEGFMGDV